MSCLQTLETVFAVGQGVREPPWMKQEVPPCLQRTDAESSSPRPFGLITWKRPVKVECFNNRVKKKNMTWSGAMFPDVAAAPPSLGSPQHPAPLAASLAKQDGVPPLCTAGTRRRNFSQLSEPSQVSE